MDFTELPQNTVEYCIYKKLDASVTEKQSALENVILDYYGFLAPDLSERIWQNESFNLRPVVNEREYYVRGRVSYGDNVNDEYFVIFLLRKLSLYDRDIVVRVHDDDGEILLIEAADHLEHWAQDPFKTEGKVFIYRGDVHIIPEAIEKDSKQVLSGFWFKPLDLIVNNCAKTRCNANVQTCIKDRLENTAQNLIHIAHCYIPVALAALLEKNPSLVSAAVQAFYIRTPSEVKNAFKVKIFDSVADSYVIAAVKFTQCLYAQITSQKMDELEMMKKQQEFSDIPQQAFVNGFKLTLGFNILLSKISNGCTNQEQNATNSHFDGFVSSLKKNGFFGDELEGSALYQERMKTCEEFFSTLPLPSASSKKVSNVYNNMKEFVENFNVEENLPKWKLKTLTPESDDNWMCFSDEEFSRFLSEKFGCAENFQDRSDVEDIAKNINKTLSDFMNYDNSGLDGAEAPKNPLANSFYKDILADLPEEMSESDSDDDMEGYGEDVGELHTITADRMKQYSNMMRNELKLKMTGFDADVDSDDDDEFDHKNIVESYVAEGETSTASGPTSTLFAAMRSKLPLVSKEEDDL